MAPLDYVKHGNSDIWWSMWKGTQRGINKGQILY